MAGESLFSDDDGGEEYRGSERESESDGKEHRGSESEAGSEQHDAEEGGGSGSGGVECSAEGVDVDLDEGRWKDMLQEIRARYNETLGVKGAFSNAVGKCVALNSADGGGYCKRCKALCLMEFSCNEGHVRMCLTCFVRECDEGVLKCGRCVVSAPASCGVRYYASAQAELAVHKHKCCLCAAEFRHGDLFSHLLTCVCLGKDSVANAVRKTRTLLGTIAQICRNHYGMPPLPPPPSLGCDARNHSASSRLAATVKNEEALTQFLDLIGPPRRALQAIFGRHC